MSEKPPIYRVERRTGIHFQVEGKLGAESSHPGDSKIADPAREESTVRVVWITWLYWTNGDVNLAMSPHANKRTALNAIGQARLTLLRQGMRFVDEGRWLASTEQPPK